MTVRVTHEKITLEFSDQALQDFLGQFQAKLKDTDWGRPIVATG